MIKTFTLTQDAEANAFIETVVEPQITITDNVIAVNYQTTKDDYENYFVKFMVDSLGRNLFNEQIRKVALEAEIAAMSDRTNFPEYDETVKKNKEADVNIARFQAKIAALNTWQTLKS